MVSIGMCGQHACNTSFMPRQCMRQQANTSGGLRTGHMASPLRHCRRQHTSRRSLAVQAGSTPVELVLKGDEGAPPLKQVFRQAPHLHAHAFSNQWLACRCAGCRVDEGRELHSIPLQRPLGATLAGKCNPRAWWSRLCIRPQYQSCQADHLGPCVHREGRQNPHREHKGWKQCCAGRPAAE